MLGVANIFPKENKTETCIFRSTESTGGERWSGQLKSRGTVRDVYKQMIDLATTGQAHKRSRRMNIPLNMLSLGHG